MFGGNIPKGKHVMVFPSKVCMQLQKSCKRNFPYKRTLSTKHIFFHIGILLHEVTKFAGNGLANIFSTARADSYGVYRAAAQVEYLQAAPLQPCSACLCIHKEDISLYIYIYIYMLFLHDCIFQKKCRQFNIAHR